MKHPFWYAGAIRDYDTGEPLSADYEGPVTQGWGRGQVLFHVTFEDVDGMRERCWSLNHVSQATA